MAIHYVDHIDDVKTQVSMFDLVSHYGFTPNRGGYICCPFHHEKTASLKIWNDHYKCFGCGASGDVIRFVENYLHIGFTEAMDEINERFNLNLPFREEKSLREIYEANKRRADRQKKIETVRTQSERFSELIIEYALYDSIMIKYAHPKNDKEAQKYATAKWNRDAIEAEIDSLPISDKEGTGNEQQKQIIAESA